MVRPDNSYQENDTESLGRGFYYKSRKSEETLGETEYIG